MMMLNWVKWLVIFTMLGPAMPLRSVYISSNTPQIGMTSHIYPKDFLEVYNEVLPSVVFIETFKEEVDPLSSRSYRQPLGTGSGFVYDKNGHVVTNCHVINKAKEVEILFKNGSFSGRWKAEVVGSDNDTDIAILRLTERVSYPDVPDDANRLNDTNHPTETTDSKETKTPKKANKTPMRIPDVSTQILPLGDSKTLRIGERVYALGNPYGLHQSLTTGIISGLDREIKAPSGRSIVNLIQTDAAINPGNSGGPLINTRGQAIGMNTAIKSPSGGSSGVGFAIPIDEVISVANEIISDGKTTKTRLGLTLLNKNNEFQQNCKLCGYTPPEGILIIDSSKLNYLKGEQIITSTRRNETTGEVILGDFLYKIEQEKISSSEQIQKILKKYKPGDILTLTVNSLHLNNERSGDRQKKVKIRLISSKNDP